MLIPSLSLIISIILLLYISYTDLKCYFIKINILLWLIILISPFLLSVNLIIFIFNLLFLLVFWYIKMLEEKWKMNSEWYFKWMWIIDWYPFFLIFGLIISSFFKNDWNLWIFIQIFTGSIAIWVISGFIISFLTKQKNKIENISKSLMNLKRKDEIIDLFKDWKKEDAKNLYLEQIYINSNYLSLFKKNDKIDESLNPMLNYFSKEDWKNQIPLFPILSAVIIFLLLF